jgi:uncharacterized PurR-regulated membrane protein YhhQ (DUF165 family)
MKTIMGVMDTPFIYLARRIHKKNPPMTEQVLV